jgi:hypothetical protein
LQKRHLQEQEGYQSYTLKWILGKQVIEMVDKRMRL